MIEQLQIAYPQTHKILGHEQFSKLATQWNQQAPFHLFLKESEIHLSHPFLPDLALLEYQLYQSYCTEMKPFNLDMDGLIEHLGQSPERVILEVSASLFLLESDYPIQEIWRAIKLDENLDQIPITPGHYFYVINTIAESTGAFLVSPIIYNTLKLMQKGRGSLDHIVSELFSDASPTQLEQVLQHILSSGWIQSYRLLNN